MNLTVGPLPPAVYWRRRAIVLGGLLVVILLLVYACDGSTTSNASGGNSSVLAAGTAGHTPSPSGPLPSQSEPLIGPSASLPAGGPSTFPTPTISGPASTPAVGLASTCTDREIKVFPVISSTSAQTSKLQYGGTFDIKLEVKNISPRVCTRDVGAVPEELYIMRGKTKIWSSDDCGRAPGNGHDVRTFQPNVLIYADVKWSSYDITTHECTKSSSPAGAGAYDLYARVGSKVSTPVTFSIEA